MFLCRLLAPSLPQRRRVAVEAAKKKRNVAVQYHVRKNSYLEGFSNNFILAIF